MVLLSMLLRGSASPSLTRISYPIVNVLAKRFKSTTYFLTVPEKESFLMEELGYAFPGAFCGRTAAGLVKTNINCDKPLPPIAFVKYEPPFSFRILN